MPFCSDSPRIASRDATVNLSDTVGTPSITVTQEEVPLTEATISPPHRLAHTHPPKPKLTTHSPASLALSGGMSWSRC
jgi:hypothetical protein